MKHLLSGPAILRDPELYTNQLNLQMTICKLLGKENSQVVESDIEITFNKFKQHKCKGLKLNF
jgi:hypothetical protein